MKTSLLYISFISLLISCNKNIIGTYNTAYSNDKSAFLQVKLNANNTVEKNEIHIIRVDSKGIWKKENENVVCYFQQTETGFPADTLFLKIIGKKMYFKRKGEINNKEVYLKKIK